MMVRVQEKVEATKKVRTFLSDAFNDYLAARVLLLSGLPKQGAILASTAMEKYLKAVLAFRGNESHGHLKSAHWNNVRNFDPKLFEQLNMGFLELNKRCYRLRYTDDIPSGFNLVIATREFLAELDKTALTIQKSFAIKKDGKKVKMEFDTLFESKDERLWAENHILYKIEGSKFIYQEQQYVYELRNDPKRGVLEVLYFATGEPKSHDFLRPGFSPKDSGGMKYEFAFGREE